MTPIRDVLADLAADVPPPTPAADLWQRGVRRRRRLQATVATTCLVAVAAVGGVWATVPAGHLDSHRETGRVADGPQTLAVPDRLFRPSGWTAGTDEAGPPGPVAVLFWDNGERHGHGGQGFVAVSAVDGSYRYVDELDGLLPGQATLSPDGRYVAFPHLTGHEVADTPVADGVAVYDAVTGTVSTRLVDTQLGVQAVDDQTMTWAGDSRTLAYDSCAYTHLTTDSSTAHCASGAELWDVGDGSSRSLPYTDTVVATWGSGLLVRRQDEDLQHPAEWASLDPATGARTVVPGVPAHDLGPVVSPGGQVAAWTRNRHVTFCCAAGDQALVWSPLPRQLPGEPTTDGPGRLVPRPTGVTGVGRIVGWVDPTRIVVLRSGRHLRIDAVDLRTGGTTPYLVVDDDYRGAAPLLAADLLQRPTVAGDPPATVVDPRLRWGLTGVVGSVALAGAVLLLRRRSFGWPRLQAAR